MTPSSPFHALAFALLSLFLTHAPLIALDATVASDSAPAVTARIEKLRAEIARHDDLYFKSATPEISDTDYDALKRELRALEAAHPELASSQSPAARVGDDGRDPFFPRMRHTAPMLSLENTYNENEIRAFDQRVRKQLAAKSAAAPLRYIVEPKIDGIGINIIYENGKLTHILTRGDGTAGDDILANIRATKALPAQLTDDGNGVPARIEIRGEIYMPFADFERINAQRIAENRAPYANARNLAAGTTKLHDAAEVARRGLRVFTYGIGACDPGETFRKPIASQSELHQRYRAWGLPVLEKIWIAESPEKLIAAIAELSALRPQLAYLIDGAVIKVDDFASQKELGSAPTAPNWAIAYKYTPRSAETRLRAITFQVGRTGVLTPVAELDPVLLAGTKISRASLHNPSEMMRKGISIGDIVVIEKAGEIIPEIVRVKTKARTAENPVTPFVFPKNCPECGTLLETDPTFRCPNSDCLAQLKRRITHYASKQCVNISGLGDVTVEKLISAKLIRNVADLYDLTIPQLTKITNSEKNAARLHAAIADSCRAELWRVIAGLGIPDVGVSTAKALDKKFGALSAISAVDETTLSQTPGVGKKSAASIASWLSVPANRELLERIEKHRTVIAK